MGEAHRESGDPGQAVNDFLRALHYGQSNRKVSAVCQLQLAKTYLALPDRAKAREHFNLWAATRRGLDNAFIRELAADVQFELSDFSLSVEAIANDIESEKADIIDIHCQALQRWITEVVVEKVGEEKGNRQTNPS